MRFRNLLKVLLILVVFLSLCTSSRILLPGMRQSGGPISSVERISPEAVVIRLRTLKELNCAQATIQTIVTTKGSTDFLSVPIASTKLLYIALGEVRAGVDLSEIEISQETDPNSIRIYMPEAKVLDAKIDITRSYVFDVRRSIFFAPDQTPLESEAQQEALKRVEESAISSGLLDLAKENSREIVKKLVESIVGKDVAVEVE